MTFERFVCHYSPSSSHRTFALPTLSDDRHLSLTPRDPHGRVPGERMLLHPEAIFAIIRDHSRQSYLFASRCDPMTALGRYVCGKSGLGGYHTPRHAIQPVSPPSFDLPTHPHSWTTVWTPSRAVLLFFFSFFSFFYIHFPLQNLCFFDHDHGDRSPGVHTLAYEPTATLQGFQAQSCERGAF